MSRKKKTDVCEQSEASYRQTRLAIFIVLPAVLVILGILDFL